MINDTEIYYDALSIPTIKYKIEKKSYIGYFQPKLEMHVVNRNYLIYGSRK